MKFFNRKLALAVLLVAIVAGTAFVYAPLARATVSAPNLSASGSAVGATSYTSNSFTIPANQLVTAEFDSRTAISTDPTQPTASGCGATWVVVQSVVYDNTSSSRKRETVFRTMVSSSTSCTVTFDEAGQSQTHAEWIIDTFTGADTSGTNGSGAVVQSVSNFDGAGTGTSLTCTLAAFSDSNNATYGALANGGGSSSITMGSGFSQVAQDFTSGAMVAATEFKTSNDTTVDFSEASGDELGCIALEIKAGPAAIPSSVKLTIQQAKLTIQQSQVNIGPQRAWPIASIDVMKTSKDVICGQPSTSTVDSYLSMIKAAGANYVGVSGFYDDPGCAADYPLLFKWSNEARTYGLHVWWRFKDLSWEGDYSVTKATSTISGGAHQVAMDNWITAHGSVLLQPGDIFTPFAEVQNGGINGISYCGPSSICQFANSTEFNTFIQVVQADAESRVPAGVQVGYWGFDGFIAAGLGNVDHSGTSYLTAATITAMHNIVAIDHYPESISSTFATDLPIIHTALPGSSIVIGEYGTITGSGDDLQVQNIRTELPPLIGDTLVVGFNYWVFADGSQEDLWTGTTLRPGYYELQRFFETIKH